MTDAYYAVATGQAYVGLLPEPAPRPRVSRALLTVLACVGLGFLSNRLYEDLTFGSVEPEAAIRYAFVTTLGTYVLVAALLVHVVRERLDWRAGPASLAIGLGLGGGLALVLLRGDVSATDPRIALLVSEGSFAPVAATVLITVVAAPLCEEMLFRGLLLESLTGYGSRVAVWVSAVAFAAWHLVPESMFYYTLFGAVFGVLYLRRGLACSMAAHAAFNGTLVAAAVVYALGPGVTVASDGLVLTAPPGWHQAGSGLHLRGPSAGEVLVEELPGIVAFDPARTLQSLVAGGSSSYGIVVRPETARTVRLPVGEAVRVRVTTGGRDGDVVLFTAHGRTYAASLLSGGSPRVRADFDKMLRDLRVRR